VGVDCLFRSWAFGDASEKIDKNIIPRFFVFNKKSTREWRRHQTSMRNTAFILIFLHIFILLGSSCGSNKSDDTLAQRLQNERDSLYVLSTYNQRELDRMTSFFDEIAACIDSINEQERVLLNQVDIETNRRYSPKELARRLDQLSGIIGGYRNRIASLVDSLNNRVDTARLAGLRSTISFLTKQLDSKEAQIKRLQNEISGQRRNIKQLSEKIENLSSSVEELSSQNSALTEAVHVQTEIINEGFVLVATKDQLKEMGVIECGGFLRRSKTNLANVSTASCNKVDIAKFKKLPIESSKIKLLSPAPSGSYRIIKNGSSSTLEILNTGAFWSLSNVMVIQIN